MEDTGLVEILGTVYGENAISSGGLTCGSGIYEEQRALWTLASPTSAEYNIAIQEFMNMNFSTSEQHRDSTKAREDRDLVDLEKISTKLTEC